MFFSQSLDLYTIHFPLRVQIRLGAHQQFAHTLWCIVIYLFNPARHVLKWNLIHDGESYQNASRTFVEGVGNISESFLPGSIPNL